MSVIWLTGLSGAGKSTIAEKLATHIDAQVVDGDVIRRSISSDLKHGKTDREENYRRVIKYTSLKNGNICEKILNARTHRDFAFSRAVSGLKKCRKITKK